MILNTQYFELYNIVLMIVAVMILFFAYRKGFIRQLLDVLTYFGSFILSIILSPFMAENFPLLQHASEYEILATLDTIAMRIANVGVWFLMLFIGLRILYRILVIIFHKRKKTKLSIINHMLGLGLGIFKVFLLAMTLSLILRFPLIRYGDVFVEHSVLSFTEPMMEQLLTYWEG